MELRTFFKKLKKSVKRFKTLTDFFYLTLILGQISNQNEKNFFLGTFNIF
jgi:hypothetical protein